MPRFVLPGVGVAGGAVTTALTIVLARTVLKGTFTDTELAALTGAFSTIITFVLGLFVRNPPTPTP